MNKRNVTLVGAVCVLIFLVAGCAQPWIRDWLEPKLEEKRARNAPPTPPTPSALLSGIDLSAGSISFDPNVTDYAEVPVPFGTTSVTVAGHTNDSGGYVTYSPSPTIMLPGAVGAVSQSVTLRVAAAGKTARTYTVSFKIGTQSESYLTGLTLSVGALTNDDSTATVDFSQSTYEYYVTVPSGTMSLTVTAQTDPHATLATVRYRQNSGAEGNNIGRGIPIDGTEKLYITVNNGAGYSDKQYTVNVLKASTAYTALLNPSSPFGLVATQGALYQDGTTTTLFDPSVSAYRLEVSPSILSTTITATAPDTSYTVASVSAGYVDTNLMDGSNILTIDITNPKPSSDPLQILVDHPGFVPTLYTIYFDYAPGNKTDALLSSLALSESISFPTFDPEVFVYNASILGSMKPLIIMATPATAPCVVSYSPANYLTSPNDGMEIKVTCSGGPEFNTKTYTINLTVTPDATSNNLTALRINGKPIDNANIADTMQPSYAEIGYPAGEFEIESSIPADASIAYMGAAPVGGGNRARVAALVAGVPRTVVILITAQNGSVKAYSITFFWAGSADNALTRVDFTRALSEDAAAYGWLNKANNMQTKTVYNIATTETAIDVKNIAAADGATIQWSITGVSGLTVYDGVTPINITGLTLDGVPKVLLVSVTPQAGAVAYYTFNIRKYTPVINYPYKNSPYEFKMPVPGKITFELWGAKGGDVTHPTTTSKKGIGGQGGYRKATTNASVTAGANFYVYTGQQGNNTTTITGAAAVYGGGGSGGNGATTGIPAGASGGGATFISTANGADITVTAVQDGRVLVAGGGGGAGGAASSTNVSNGGYGSGGATAGSGFGAGYGASASRGNVDGIGTNGRSGSTSHYNGGAAGAGGGGGGYRGGLSQTATGDGTNASGGGGNGWSATGYTADVVEIGTNAGPGKATITVTPDMP